MCRFVCVYGVGSRVVQVVQVCRLLEGRGRGFCSGRRGKMAGGGRGGDARAGESGERDGSFGL